jgi:hypothetical protein
MKKSIFILSAVALLGTSMVSCNKNTCSECHYEDATGAEVELGEKCGDELEDLEANGTNVGGTNYEVHCHEH